MNNEHSTTRFDSAFGGAKQLLVAMIGLACASSAFGNFIIDPNPGGVMFYNGDANHDVSSFTGFVGGQHSGPNVTVTTIGTVDTGAGFSNIKPKDGSLTSLVFTPANANLFDDFSFRGQLETAADGTVKVTVVDNQGDPAQTFTFTGLGKNADFAAIGIEAAAGSGDTIKSITLLSDFKEEKQNEFSYAPGIAPVPEPSTILSGAMLLLPFGAGTLRVLRKKIAA